MQPALIGILAGMGPRSTAPFVDMVVSECQRQYGARYDDEFPPMMIYSLPTPLYVDRPIDEGALRASIRAGLQKLEDTGAALIAMPCNAAHVYYQELAGCIRVPLLNMVDEALRALPEAAGKLALLAARPTVEAGIYQAGIERAGARLVADEIWQEHVDRLIATIKTSPDRRTAAAMWQDLLAMLAAAGVDTALLACTDLNAAGAASCAGITVFDATQCLAAALVREWRGLSR